MNKDATPLCAEVEVNAPMELVWQTWTNPADIMQWNAPNDDWTTLHADNDVQEGGRFLFVMAAKDGSDKFDYTGTYVSVIPHQMIKLRLDDGRETVNSFTAGNAVLIKEVFDPMPGVATDLQQAFCQGVLNRFKSYTELKLAGKEG